VGLVLNLDGFLWCGSTKNGAKDSVLNTTTLNTRQATAPGPMAPHSAKGPWRNRAPSSTSSRPAGTLDLPCEAALEPNKHRILPGSATSVRHHGNESCLRQGVARRISKNRLPSLHRWGAACQLLFHLLAEATCSKTACATCNSSMGGSEKAQTPQRFQPLSSARQPRRPGQVSSRFLCAITGCSKGTSLPFECHWDTSFVTLQESLITTGEVIFHQPGDSSPW
jgi:hypothetical protein